MQIVSLVNTSAPITLSLPCARWRSWPKETRYQSFLKVLTDENKIVGNYFVGLNEVEASMPSTEHIELSYDKPLLKPVVTSDKTSHLSMEDVWDSHPSIEDRLENAAQFPSKDGIGVRCVGYDSEYNKE